MTSWRPYWPSKTIKRRPCWCSKQILWNLNYFFYVNAFFCSKRVCVYAVQTRFVTGWENNRDGYITMPLSLKTIGGAGYRDQWNKRFGWVKVNRSMWVKTFYYYQPPFGNVVLLFPLCSLHEILFVWWSLNMYPFTMALDSRRSLKLLQITALCWRYIIHVYWDARLKWFIAFYRKHNKLFVSSINWTVFDLLSITL